LYISVPEARLEVTLGHHLSAIVANRENAIEAAPSISAFV
jgi:hypothetical protein